MTLPYARLAAVLAAVAFFTACHKSPAKAVGPASAQAPVALWPQEKSDIPADPAVIWGALPNGVRYAVMQHSEPPKRLTLRLYVNAGSMMEEENQRGLAHFLEHMAFNGTKHHAAGEMVEYFQRIGMGFGNDTNAHTSWDETVYKLELPGAEDAMMDDSMQMLRDYADGILLDKKEIDDERGIILAEKRDRDSVQYRMFTDSLGFSMPDSLIPRRLTIGEASVISKATREDFLSFYGKWYTPDRMIVVVVGDIEPARAGAFIQKYFGDMPANAAPAPDPSLGDIKPRGTVAKVLRDPEAPAVDISISIIRRLPETYDTVAERGNRLARKAANAIVERRLQILAKEDGAPFLEGAAYTFKWLNFVDCSEIDLSCQPQRWTEALAVAEQQLRKALQHGFTKAELSEAVANLRNDYEEAVKQAKTRKSFNMADQMLGCVGDRDVFSSPEQDLAIAAPILDALTPETVLAALRKAWEGDTRIVYACGNLPEGASDELALSTYQDSAKNPVEAPAVVESAEFAYSNFGQPTRVAGAQVIMDLGITQMQFANNVCVNIKPTDFEKNVVRVMVRFGSGMLEAPKDKPGLAMLANMAFAQGGLEAHSADDLARIFAGRSVQVSFAVQPDSFTLTGATSPRDLQDELNLMAAYMTAPGYRDEALRQARKTIPQVYMQIAHTPEGVVQNEVSSFLASGDFRFGFPKQDELMARDMADLRAWLAGPLAHSRMEISIVGDFDVDAITPMVARTFGALPVREASKRELTDERKIVMPEAQVRTFTFSTELPKAESMFVWPTADQWNIARTRRLSVLADILTDRMRVELREKLGEAYSPYAMNSASDTYKDYGYMACISSISPDKVEQAAALIRNVGADLAAKGVTQDELDRTLKPMFEEIVQWRRNNNYWLGSVMSSCQEYPVRLDWTRSMVDDLHSITVEDINKLAAVYLQPERAIDIRIAPDAKTEEVPADVAK